MYSIMKLDAEVVLEGANEPHCYSNTALYLVYSNFTKRLIYLTCIAMKKKISNSDVLTSKVSNNHTGVISLRPLIMLACTWDTLIKYPRLQMLLHSPLYLSLLPSLHIVIFIPKLTQMTNKVNKLQKLLCLLRSHVKTSPTR